MKKISELLKPFLSIIFGAIVFFEYSWFLSGAGATLAVGIIATVIAAYFLVVGILSIVLGDKMSKKCKDLLTVGGICGYAWLTTTIWIITMVYGIVGVNAWIISILTAVASFGFGLFLILAQFAGSKFINRLAQLFGAIFVLALLLNVLIPLGVPVTVGNIVILEVVLYATYAVMAFEVMGQLKVEETPKAEETPVQE